MFAPRPFDVAKEVVRVTKKGGRIVLGNWIPGDATLVAQTLKISSAYAAPPPDGFVSPMLWGIESQVIERFTAAGIAAEDISFSKETFRFEAEISSATFVDRFRRFYGPTMNAFEAAEKAEKGTLLQQELEALFASQNETETDDSLSIPATYLRVTIKKH
jgi:hypothetical protein